MKVHGRCHCGAVRFEAAVDPEQVTVCHCTDCQSLTGSAYRVSVPAPSDTFELQAGAPVVYVKVAESGAQRAQTFCPTCGSPLYTYAAGEGPRSYGLRVGCLDERRQLVPRRQIWCRSALPWTADLTKLGARPRE